MRRRRNADDRIRALERAALQGDSEARERLIAEYVRIGKWHKVYNRNNLTIASLKGYYAPFPGRTDEVTGLHFESFGHYTNQDGHRKQGKIYIAKIQNEPLYFLEREAYIMHQGVIRQWLVDSTLGGEWHNSVATFNHLKLFQTKAEAQERAKLERKTPSSSYPEYWHHELDLKRTKVKVKSTKVPVRVCYETP